MDSPPSSLCSLHSIFFQGQMPPDAPKWVLPGKPRSGGTKVATSALGLWGMDSIPRDLSREGYGGQPCPSQSHLSWSRPKGLRWKADGTSSEAILVRKAENTVLISLGPASQPGRAMDLHRRATTCGSRAFCGKVCFQQGWRDCGDGRAGIPDGCLPICCDSSPSIRPGLIYSYPRAGHTQT